MVRGRAAAGHTRQRSEERDREMSKGNSETRGGQEDVGAAEIRHAVALAAEAAFKAFDWDTAVPDRVIQSSGTNNKGPGNELSHVIPGYTAPMKLEAKSLGGMSVATLSQLRSRAARSDSSASVPSAILKRQEETFDPVAATSKVRTPSSISTEKKAERVTKIPTTFSSSFKKRARRQHDNTAGSGWFNMNPTAMTDDLKADLSIIANRNYLDPKKFYKSSDKFDGKVLQVGTVIEGSSEFFSSRLAKRDRRQNLTEEIMADSGVSNYAKRKYREMQQDRRRQKATKYNKRSKKMR
ncbi:hypothetical protein THAOC_06597 [Thalassiosira oceanica]|uniref:Fcf2 pre-rRNA processing C-terminal domain-containing protein n=1 Tax=Thalassiosira oceanica TaxID=159749 RepID=K0SZW1_THAOC|nr:hypothetical protein THAOC_06597 [Thalassiosira oceanica]|eukprot:EJK71923.1 hypothetical protein THAOC_06597 [Thalassiosira oceanica]